MNPLFPIEYIVIFFGTVVCLGTYLSWRSSSLAPKNIRITISILRFLALISLAVIAFDPGYWKIEKEELTAEWAIMLDNSSSMKVEDVDGKSRFTEALKLTEKMTQGTANIKIYPFSKNISQPIKSPAVLKQVQPQGQASDITGSGSQLLQKYTDSGQTLKGIVIISDGRETILNNAENFPLLSRAKNIPLYGICYGGKFAEKDLGLILSHRNYTIFKGQTQKITLKVENKNLGKVKTSVKLTDKNGATLQEQDILLENNSTKKLNFNLKLAKPGFHELWFKVPENSNEKIIDNNKAEFTASVIDEKLKVLLVEGRPYWDSKFLSQVLRKNANIDLTGIYRLSPKRYFLVQEGADSPEKESSNVIFPDTLEELSAYNLIIFGKGADFFLNDDRINILKSFIRDYGGAILFARGKPYSGDWRGLNSIEPVYWGDMLTNGFRWQPTAAGINSGLFGEMLPNAEGEIWQELPLVERAFRCPELKSFSEVLLLGKSEKTKLEIPVLISRKYGKGIVLAVNSEGLWRWDFFPLKGKTGDFYKNFWTQLAFWAIKYSDFLPNQDYSLFLSKNKISPNEEIIAQINSREKFDKNLNLTLKITKQDKLVKEISPAYSTGHGWNGLFSISEPGRYKVSLNIPGRQVEDIFTMLHVQSPPKETDNFSSAPEQLKSIVEQGGGCLIKPNELSELISGKTKTSLEDEETDKEWISGWNLWWTMLLLLGFFSAECYLRRRNGML